MVDSPGEPRQDFLNVAVYVDRLGLALFWYVCRQPDNPFLPVNVGLS